MPSQSSQSRPEESVSTLFQQVERHGWLRKFTSHFQILQRLQAWFDQACPLELHGQCQVLGIYQSNLLIGVGQAGVGARLKYHAGDLLRSLHSYPEWADVKKLQVRVLYQSSSVVEATPTPALLTQESVSSLRTIANQISDPVLKAALLKFTNG